MSGRFCQLTLAASFWLVPVAVSAQGTITGRVTEQTNQQPVPSAQVTIVGTTRGTITNDKGEYTIRNVPAGSVTLRATRIGFAARTQPVTVTAGGTVTADFVLEPTPTRLDELVVTATGESQRRRETAVSISSVDVDSLNLAPVHTMSDVLTSRTPGVIAQSNGGTAGSGTRIRIRGSNSVSLSNDPLIIIDGVRVNGNEGSSTIGVGGQVPSRLDDLNPEDIEKIDVIKGPAASSLYGTAAANGVIQITTKHGVPGRTQWSAHIGGGGVKNSADFPANYAAIDVEGPDTVFAQSIFGIGCTTEFQLLGFCRETDLQSFNPLVAHSPFITGTTQNYGLSLAGGTEQAQYYLSGELDKDQGVYDINRVRRASLRGNIGAHLGDKFDLTFNSGYSQIRTRLPQNDNNIRGIVPQGLLGKAFDDPIRHGFGFDTPQDIFAINTQQNTERYTGSVNGTWRPLKWLSVLGTTGLDFANRMDQELIPSYLDNGLTSRFADDSLGARTSNPFQTFLYTLNTSASANYGLRENLSATSTVGFNYNNNTVRGTFAFGKVLAPGTGSLNGATQTFLVGEANSKDIILGGYAQQQLNWKDRFYLSGTLRADKNNAFGQNFKTIYYPGFGASWVVGDEPWFPRTEIVSHLRLRAAYGQSGQQPGFRDAVRYYSPVSVAKTGGDEPGFTQTTANIGNPNLKPERTSETELGFEGGVWKDKLAVDFTWYDKQTRDALILRPLAPSNGNVQQVFQNLGRVSNRGLEMQLTGAPIDVHNFRWDITFNGTHNNNKVENLGAGIAPIIFNGSHQRHQNGYPLGGYWGVPYTFQDLNKDGIIDGIDCPGPNCEVTLGDSAVFLGSPFPKWELSFSSGFTFFRYFRVNGLLDRRAGYKLLNFTERFRCVSFGVCLAANQNIDPAAPKTASLADQARYMAGLLGTDAGYVEDASFWKLRELSLTVSAPDRWAHQMGMTAVSLTFAGRNLATWTKYTGLDPEINENAGFNFATDEFLTQPPVRTYSVRLNVNW